MITFRKSKESELEIIRDIAYKTWPSTYNPIIGTEQVRYMLDKMYNKGVLLEQLMAGCTFIIATKDDKDVGFISFDMVDKGEGIFKLHKLYLLPEEHGKGLGKIMMNEVCSLVRRRGGKKLQLNVNKQNRAFHFYQKIGFTNKEAVTLDIGNGFVMDDYIMEIDISPEF